MPPPPGRSLNFLHIKGSRKRDGKERGDGEVSLSDVLLEGSDGQMGGADEDVVVFFIHGSMGHMQQFEHQISCCAVSLQRDAAGRGCAHLSSALRKNLADTSPFLLLLLLFLVPSKHGFLLPLPPLNRTQSDSVVCHVSRLLDQFAPFSNPHVAQAMGYSVIAFDAYGCGDSPKPHDWEAYSHKEHIQGTRPAPYTNNACTHLHPLPLMNT